MLDFWGNQSDNQHLNDRYLCPTTTKVVSLNDLYNDIRSPNRKSVRWFHITSRATVQRSVDHLLNH